jgi:hypothetical protein
MSGVNAHGTMIKVGDGTVGSPVAKSVSAAEAGSPTIMNAADHGFYSGQYVVIAGSSGATGLNATFIVTVITEDVFTVPFDSTGDTITGTITATAQAAESFTSIKACKDITLPSASTDEIDITTHDSAGKEFMDGDTDYGEVGFDINYDPAEPTHVLLQALSMSKDRHNWQAIMTDDGAQTWAFEGWVKTFQLSAPVSGVYTATVAIRVTGAPSVA